VSVKKLIDDWLRKVTQHEITVSELRKYRNIKAFTRNFLRELKNPKLASSTPDSPKQKEKTQPTPEDIALLPTFEIENSQNIMVITSNND
jgi:hypothetical protein